METQHSTSLLFDAGRFVLPFLSRCNPAAAALHFLTRLHKESIISYHLNMWPHHTKAETALREHKDNQTPVYPPHLVHLEQI